MKISTILFIFLGLTISAISQNDNSNTRLFWVGGQVGSFITSKDIRGFSGGINLNAVRGHNLCKIRYFYDERFQLFEPIERYNEAGVLIGKSYYGSFAQINISAGLGITTGELVSKTTEIRKQNTSWWTIMPTVERLHEYDNFTTPCIPLEVEFLLKPLQEMGIGVAFSGNLNTKRPVFRTSLSLNLGKLR